MKSFKEYEKEQENLWLKEFSKNEIVVNGEKLAINESKLGFLFKGFWHLISNLAKGLARGIESAIMRAALGSKYEDFLKKIDLKEKVASSLKYLASLFPNERKQALIDMENKIQNISSEADAKKPEDKQEFLYRLLSPFSGLHQFAKYGIWKPWVSPEDGFHIGGAKESQEKEKGRRDFYSLANAFAAIDSKTRESVWNNFKNKILAMDNRWAKLIRKAQGFSW